MKSSMLVIVIIDKLEKSEFESEGAGGYNLHTQ